MLLLDMNNISAKFYYSKKKNENDLFKFVSKLISMDKFIVGVFDGMDAGRLKKNKYPRYKSNRLFQITGNMPTYLDLLSHILVNHGIPIISYPKYEADDIIIGMASYLNDNGYKKVINCISDDIDLYQMYYFIDNVNVLDTGLYYYNRNLLHERLALEKKKFADKLFKGDHSDNLPSLLSLFDKGKYDEVDIILSISYFPKYEDRKDILSICGDHWIIKRILEFDEGLYD